MSRPSKYLRISVTDFDGTTKKYRIEPEKFPEYATRTLEALGRTKAYKSAEAAQARIGSQLVSRIQRDLARDVMTLPRVLKDVLDETVMGGGISGVSMLRGYDPKTATFISAASLGFGETYPDLFYKRSKGSNWSAEYKGAHRERFFKTARNNLYGQMSRLGGRGFYQAVVGSPRFEAMMADRITPLSRTATRIVEIGRLRVTLGGLGNWQSYAKSSDARRTSDQALFGRYLGQKSYYKVFNLGGSPNTKKGGAAVEQDRPYRPFISPVLAFFANVRHPNIVRRAFFETNARVRNLQGLIGAS